MKGLVEDCQKLQINDFVRIKENRFFPRKDYRNMLKERGFLDLEIDNEVIRFGLTTTKTNFNGFRFWFVCPKCNKGVGILYRSFCDYELKCRNCHGLLYETQKISHTSKYRLYRLWGKMIKIVARSRKKGLRKKKLARLCSEVRWIEDGLRTEMRYRQNKFVSRMEKKYHWRFTEAIPR